MKTEKITTLTLEIAKQMFVSNVESLKQFALHHYTEEELTKKEFPKRWEDLERISGCYVTASSVYEVQGYSTVKGNIGIFPDKTTAKAVLALAQLLQLRNRWWEIDGNWKPDIMDGKEKYAIEVYRGELNIQWYASYNKIFYFRTKEIAQEFLETFRESLEICKSLI
jgi:hypothetical protein